MISVTLVPVEHVPHVWDIAAPMIDEALAYCGGLFVLEDVYHDLLDGEQTLWLALQDGEIIGCTTLSIIQYPRERTLCYKWLGGKDVTLWLAEGHRVCSSYARELGCTRLECFGRSGWKKFLENLGWRQTGVQYEFELKD